MKRIVSLVLVFFLLLLCGCGRNEIATDKTILETTSQTEIKWTDYVYPPEEIKLVKSLQVMGLEFINTGKRFIYYDIPLPGTYLPAAVRDAFYANRYGQGPEPTEMVLVSFIKEYKIPKSVFEEVVQRMAEDMLNEGCDLSNEIFELPNPDIIYTFDNEIIDAYYRRENPLAPN